MESGATAWEVREMTRLVRDGGTISLAMDYLKDDLPDILGDAGFKGDFDDIGIALDQLSVGDHYTNAILIEALELLAEKKEAARAHG